MSTRASIKGHPIHSMMIGLPVGLFVFSLFSDVVWLFNGSQAWATVALYTLAGAVATALLSAVPGIVDYAGITQLKAKHTARTHGLLNLAAVGLGALSLWMRLDETGGGQSLLPIALSFLTVLLLGVSGWLGATLVHVQGVSQPDAPNESLSRAARTEAATLPGGASRSASPARRAGVDGGRGVDLDRMGGMSPHPAMRDDADGSARPRDARPARGSGPDAR